MKSKLRWGILSTGRIAGIFAEGVRRSRSGVLAAVGSRARASAEKFARRFHIPKAHGSYAQLLKDPSVEALYIATPHPHHLHWILKAAKAGKHILCEKPLTLSARDTAKAVEAAGKHQVFLMEAFMYRCHPQTAKLLQLIRQGKIGEVRLIQAVFCFDAPLDLKHRLFNKKLGGGGIWDVGCYPLSMARLLAGAALGKAFVEPLEVKGTGIIGKKSGVDEMALASVKFPGGILAELSCGIRVDRGHSKVHVYGSQGALTVPSPWFAAWSGEPLLFYFNRRAAGRKSKSPSRAVNRSMPGKPMRRRLVSAGAPWSPRRWVGRTSWGMPKAWTFGGPVWDADKEGTFPPSC